MSADNPHSVNLTPTAEYGVMCEVCSDSRGALTEEEAFAYAVRHLDQPFIVKVPHRPYVVKRLTLSPNDGSER